VTRQRLLADGAVHLPAAIDRTHCAVVCELIDVCRAAPGPHYGVLSTPGRPVVDSDLFRWLDVKSLAEVLFLSALPALAADLLGSDDVVFVEDQWLASEPGADTPSPWHQDAPYYNIDGEFVTLWLALDDAPAAAALRAVPQSHTWGRTFASVAFADSMTTDDGAGDLDAVPPAHELDDRAIGWDVQVGDVIALHPLTLHSAGRAVLSDRWFRRLSTRWASPTALYVDRGEQAAAFWSMLPHGLRPGDALACDTFPLLRPR
jgi:hypothetical protein